MTEAHKRLGDALVEMGLVEREIVERAVRVAQDRGVPMGDVLLDDEVVDEADLYIIFAQQVDREFARADDLLVKIDPKVVASASRDYLEAHLALPLRVDNGKLLAATCVPTLQLPELGLTVRANTVEYVVVTPTDFTRLWSQMNLGPLSIARAKPRHEGADEDTSDEAKALSALEESKVLRLFEQILADAAGVRATDVHLEMYGKKVRLRYRIDGDLQTVSRIKLTPADMAGIISVVKIQSHLDIAERRRPQGGSLHRVINGQAIDMRIQTAPTLYGEYLIVRLLPQKKKRFSVDELGFSESAARKYRRLLDSPSGMILIVGPTGSGKTTTLYAALSIFARDETRKVITIEDPVEYVIDGVQQTQIHNVLGYTFANAMRVIVRQDPDVVMLGEIRDPETALETIRASQTGHLVLTTLHCNDTVDAVQRLIDLGAHPNSISSELLAIIAQRLAPRICSSCKVECPPDPEIAVEVFPQGVPVGFKTYRGTGCERCGGAGVYERVAVYEFLSVTTPLRLAVTSRRPSDELREQAIRGGLVPMRDIALAMVNDGTIPFAALRQILLPERMAPDNPDKPFVEKPEV